MTRKLDSLVAEKVMGWVSSPDNPWGYPALRGPWWKTVPQRVYSLYETQHATNTPPFSASIDAAWEVVEKMRASDWAVRIEVNRFESDDLVSMWANDNNPKAGESYSSGDGRDASAVPLNVCLCALRAVGVPESEITAAMEGER